MRDYDQLFTARREAIRRTEDKLQISGTAYYLSENGDDSHDGRDPHRLWKTLKRRCVAELKKGAECFMNGAVCSGDR